MKKPCCAIYVYAGYEHRAKAAFGHISVPKDRIVEIARHETYRRTPDVSELRAGSGRHDGPSWHVIRWILKVIGLVGREKSPIALSGTEAEEILNRVGATAVKLRPKTIFGVADRGKIADGLFRKFTATVEELNPERASVKGRAECVRISNGRRARSDANRNGPTGRRKC